MVDATAVESHYASAGIVERILAVFAPGEAITPDALAPMDHFHGRGVEATRELAVRLDPQPGEHLLDLGCGLGGPARWLAAHFGCRVTGIDLTDAFCAAAERLTQLTGQADVVRTVRGDALDTPFEDASFDRAYSQNVVMNVSDKRAFYREALRVLKPGGLLVLSNLGEGPNGPPYYPTPWAETARTSFLVSAHETRAGLEAAGFRIESIEETTDRVRPQVVKTLAKLESAGFPERNVHVAMGEGFKERQLNSMRSIRDGRTTLIEAVARKPAG